MATSNIWSEGYWRNVSFVQGLLCAAEVITIFIFSCPKTGQFKSWVASGVCKIFNYIPSLKCTMCNGNVQCAMKIYIEKLSGHPLSYIFSPTPQLSTALGVDTLCTAQCYGSRSLPFVTCPSSRKLSWILLARSWWSSFVSWPMAVTGGSLRFHHFVV